jgi:hypothetical protein
VVRHLPSKCKALSSNPNLTKKICPAQVLIVLLSAPTALVREDDGAWLTSITISVIIIIISQSTHLS